MIVTILMIQLDVRNLEIDSDDDNNSANKIEQRCT